MNNQLDYGNWIPINLIKLLTTASILFIILTIILINFQILSTVLAIITAIVIIITSYMLICRYVFSHWNNSKHLINRRNYIHMDGYDGLMGQIHHFLLEHLDWDGDGKLIDIGCGSGALTIRCAKKFPNGKFIGIDYWGREWNYARNQCQHNAKLEKVDDRIKFYKCDASKLTFDDEEFDAAVSNFVFHEVKTQSDKTELIKEALRVVKKGGVFAFQDLFSQENLYGDIDVLIYDLKASGISKIHFIKDVEKIGFIPRFVQAPGMIRGIGLIYGRK